MLPAKEACIEQDFSSPITGHAPISIIFMLAADFLYFVLYFLVWIHAVKPFLPVHIGRFRHLSIGEKVFQFE